MRQDELNPGLIEWDLKDTDAWLPFFNEDFPIEDHPVVSVQVDASPVFSSHIIMHVQAPAINYMPFDQIQSAAQISESIMKSIRGRVVGPCPHLRCTLTRCCVDCSLGI